MNEIFGQPGGANRAEPTVSSALLAPLCQGKIFFPALHCFLLALLYMQITFHAGGWLKLNNGFQSLLNGSLEDCFLCFLVFKPDVACVILHYI